MAKSFKWWIRTTGIKRRCKDQATQEGKVLLLSSSSISQLESMITWAKGWAMEVVKAWVRGWAKAWAREWANSSSSNSHWECTRGNKYTHHLVDSWREWASSNPLTKMCLSNSMCTSTRNHKDNSIRSQLSQPVANTTIIHLKNLQWSSTMICNNSTQWTIAWIKNHCFKTIAKYHIDQGPGAGRIKIFLL